MGLSNSAGGRRTFLNIKEGKITLKDKDGNIQAFNQLSGMLTAITFKEPTNPQFGRELHLTIVDDGEQFLLQMKLDSGYARGFMMAIKNADLRLPVTLVPKYEEANGKKKSTLFINQDGKGLKWFWTRDNPGDLPQPESREWKGKIEWDYSAQTAYLENMLLTEIVPQLPHPAVAGAYTGPQPTAQFKPETTPADQMPEDDLPF